MRWGRGWSEVGGWSGRMEWDGEWDGGEVRWEDGVGWGWSEVGGWSGIGSGMGVE